MDNYKKMQEAARQHFLEYDYKVLSRHTGVVAGEQGLQFRFLGQECYVNQRTGEITVDGRKANFCESLTIYDWLCDGKANATATNEFCTINSLPGVFVSGGGLAMNGNSVAPLIAQNQDKFLALCATMGGKQVTGADLAVIIDVFPDLSVLLKFYDGDEEFAPSLTLLWDTGILQFIRYETIYYLAGCLCNLIRKKM